MKRMKSYALMSAIALIGAVGLTACSSSDETVVNNPNYNPETNEVNTKFVFNVSTSNGVTRQTSAATQATDADRFRGIDNAVLLAFKSTADGKHLSKDLVADKRYDLGQVLAPYTIDQENSRRVIETSLPLNTNTLVFYGKATEGNAYGYNYPAWDEFGHLENFAMTDNMDLKNFSIVLGQRLTGDQLAKYRQTEDLLSAILTVIMNTNMAGDNHVSFAATAAPFEGVAPYGYDVSADDYPATLKWADYANANGTSPVETTHALYPLEKKLADVYREMTTIKHATGEVRAGSGYALRLTIHDLWSNINEVRCALPTNVPEAVAKYMAHNITLRLRRYFGYSSLPIDGHAPEDVAFRDPMDIIAELRTDEWPSTADAKPSDFSAITNNDNLNAFPYSFNLPRGAAHLDFDYAKKQFTYVKNFNTSAMDGTPITVEYYRYPSELMYFGNSPVRVTSMEKKTTDYPNGVAKWDNDDNWTADWVKDSHVTSATQAVAMQNDINYGTALMKTTVRYSASSLYDNNHAIQKQKFPELSENDEPDKVINVNGTSFQLTGIIIGGMVMNVGWDYIAKSNDPYSAWVYDRAIVSPSIPAMGEGASQPNYTMLFDNYRRADHQDKVYVALEFLNNSGENFFGEHNMIRDRSHFYLIGELDPERTDLNAIEWPTNHPLPPYDENGNTIKTPRVFMQDFMTQAEFVIGPNSLKHAYLTVPDLRYSSLTLGLSVDIKWSTGLDFGDIILGGD